MKAKVVRDRSGVIRNIGAWDVKIEKRLVGPGGSWHTDASEFVDQNGKLLDGYEWMLVETNPMPAGYVEGEADLQEGADGGLYGDYRMLRRVAYPDVRDQLDAIWKGGEEMESMRQAIMAIKAKYR